MKDNAASRLLVSGTGYTVFNPQLAKAFGIPTALILQQLHYWLTQDTAFNNGGHRWVTRGAQEWVDRLQVFDIRTVRNSISSMERLGFVFSDYFGRQDNRKSYRIDYSVLCQLLTERVPGFIAQPTNSGSSFHLVVESPSTTYINKRPNKNSNSKMTESQ